MIVLYNQVENASQTQALRVALAEIRGHDRTETSKKHAFPHHKKLNGDSIWIVFEFWEPMILRK